jgi:hypothetical protein
MGHLPFQKARHQEPVDVAKCWPGRDDLAHDGGLGLKTMRVYVCHQQNHMDVIFGGVANHVDRETF